MPFVKTVRPSSATHKPQVDKNTKTQFLTKWLISKSPLVKMILDLTISLQMQIIAKSNNGAMNKMAVMYHKGLDRIKRTL